MFANHYTHYYNGMYFTKNQFEQHMKKLASMKSVKTRSIVKQPLKLIEEDYEFVMRINRGWYQKLSDAKLNVVFLRQMMVVYRRFNRFQNGVMARNMQRAFFLNASYIKQNYHRLKDLFYDFDGQIPLKGLRQLHTAVQRRIRKFNEQIVENKISASKAVKSFREKYGLARMQNKFFVLKKYGKITQGPVDPYKVIKHFLPECKTMGHVLRRDVYRQALGIMNAEEKHQIEIKENIIRANKQMMAEDAHGTDQQTHDVAGNVDITSGTGEEKDSIAKIASWVPAVTEDIVGNFTEMSDRWFIIANNQWKNTDTRNSCIFSVSLPDGILSDNADVVNLAPFRNHRLWRGDIEIKVCVNSQKFMCGQLQCAWRYLNAFDMQNNKKSLCESIYTLSQCMHGIIDAGGCNEVTLTIPFKNFSSMLNRCASGNLNRFAMGKFYINVIGQLRTANDLTTCDYVVYMRFVNSQFSAQISADLVACKQMMPALAMGAAMKLLDTVDSDRNRDKPPMVQAPAYVVPTATHSWCNGTNVVDVLHTLRLDARGQTHHPNNISRDPHQTIKDIARVFTLREALITWKTSDASGTQLKNFKAVPTKVSSGDNKDGYLSSFHIPASNVVSSCFAQWRGSLEYRFDVVATQFHTGMLLVAFIPGYVSKPEEIKLKQAKSSYHAVFDLQLQRSFTFVVPYVNGDLWMRSRASMNGAQTEYSTHGTIIVFVLNQLRCVSTAPDTIDILIYERVGDSFELSVPIQPYLGLSVQKAVIPNLKDTVREDRGYKSVYYGTWSSEGLDNRLVLRYGILAGEVCTFNGVSAFMDSTEECYWRLNCRPQSKDGQPRWPYAVPVYYDGRWCLMWPWISSSERQLKQACALGWSGRKDGTWKDYVGDASQTSAGAYVTADDVVSITRTLYKTGEELETVEADKHGERNNPQELMGTASNCVSTNFGYNSFGENFNDIIDLMRRYQYMAEYVVPQEALNITNAALFKFAANPMGMLMNLTGNNANIINNKCRDGLIPLILSAFKFYRGSLRYRIVLPPTLDVNLWVQHRPEVILEKDEIMPAFGNNDEMAIYAHGYASYIQHTTVNGLIEFEVPFYQPGTYGVLNKGMEDPNHRLYTNNGTVVVGTNVASDIKKLIGQKIEIFYSIGDDFSFNTFQGFMPMVNALLVSNVIKAEKQMLSWSNPFAGAVKEIEGTLDRKTESIVDCVSNSTEKIIEQSNRVITEMKNEANKIVGKTFENLGWFELLWSNIIHCLANFNIKTIAISIANFLGFLGMKAGICISTICKFAYTVFRKFGITVTESLQTVKSKVMRKQNSTVLEQTIETELNTIHASKQANDNEHETTIAWISMIFTVICGYLGLKKKPKDAPVEQWARETIKTMGDIARADNSIVTWLKNHIELIISIFEWIKNKLLPESRMIKKFEKGGRARLWLEEVLDLENWHRSNTTYDQNYINRVETAYSMGSIIMTETLKEEVEGRNKTSHLLTPWINKIGQMSEEMKTQGQHPSSRLKPLHLQFYGDAGVGKSHIQEDVCKYILKNVCKYTHHKGPLTTTIFPTMTYWEHMEGREPIMLFDDLFNVQQGEELSKQISYYFQLYGDIAFIPPMANLEAKKMRIQPKVVGTSTNFPFPSWNGVYMPAVYRRRDVLIEARNTANIRPDENIQVRKVPNCPHCNGENNSRVPNKWFKDYHHVLFNVKNILDPLGDDVANNLSYFELLDFLEEYLQPVWEKNMETWMDKLSKYNATIETIGEKNIYDLVQQQTLDMNMFNSKIDIQCNELLDDMDTTTYAASLRRAIMRHYSNAAHAVTRPWCATIQKYRSWMDDDEKEEYRKLNEVPKIDICVTPNPTNKFKYDKHGFIIEDDEDDMIFECRKEMGNELELFTCRDGTVATIEDDLSAIKVTQQQRRLKNIANFKISPSVLEDMHYHKEQLFDNVERSDQTSKVLNQAKANDVFDNFELAVDDQKWAESINMEIFTPFINNYINDLKSDNDFRNIVEACIASYTAKMQFGYAAPINFEFLLRTCSQDRRYKECVHTDNRFIRAEFARGAFVLARDLIYQDSEYCEGFCVRSMFKQDWHEYWVNYRPARRLLLRNKKYELLPSYFGEQQGEITPLNMKQTIVEVLKYWRDLATAQLNADTWLGKTLRLITNVVVMIREFLAACWPVLIPLTTIITTVSHLKKKTDYIDKQLENYAREQKQKMDETKAWMLTQDFSKMSKREISQAIYDHIDETCEMELVLPQGSQYHQENVRTVKAMKPPSYATANKQMGPTPQAAIAEERVRKNTILIYAKYENEGIVYEPNFRCLCLGGRRILALRHYREYWNLMPKDTIFSYGFAQDHEKRIPHADKIRIDFSKIEFLDYQYDVKLDSNFIEFEMPRTFTEMQDLTKFIAPMEAHTRVGRRCLFVRPGSSSMDLELSRDQRTCIIGEQATPIGNCDETITMVGTYQYRASQFGYCGSVILDPTLQCPIIGMHVAGFKNTDMGISEVMCKETFSRKVSVKYPVVDMMDVKLGPIDVANIDLEAPLILKGTLDATEAESQSDVTQYVRSVIYDEIEPALTEPMPLSGRDHRVKGNDPLKLGSEKHGKIPIPFPQLSVDTAEENLREKILFTVKPIRADCGLLTLEQAICGDKEYHEFVPLEWSSSEGYPMKHFRPKGVNGKKWLFDLEETPDGLKLKGMDKRLKDLLEVELSMRKNGIKCQTYFTNKLKDTCGEKIKARTPGKTRTFSTSPVQYNILFRQYFGDFIAAYKRNRIESEHGIGMSVNSEEWTRVANYIQQKGKNIIPGDYSNFGDGLQTECMAASFRIINAWYAEYSTSPTLEQDQIVRSVLASEAMCCQRISKNLVYQALCGIPSGFPATDVMNSMVNSLYVRIGWMHITNKSLTEFEKNCNVLTYGDDLLINVSDSYIEIYNTQTLHDFFKIYNIKFTDCDKGDDIIRYRQLHNSPFLKRNFVPHPFRMGIYIGKIDRMSVGNCLNWVHKKDDLMEASMKNAEQALELIYGWGPNEYNCLRNKLYKAFKERGQRFLAPSWHDVDNRIFSEQNIPLPKRQGLNGV